MCVLRREIKTQALPETQVPKKTHVRLVTRAPRCRFRPKESFALGSSAGATTRRSGSGRFSMSSSLRCSRLRRIAGPRHSPSSARQRCLPATHAVYLYGFVSRKGLFNTTLYVVISVVDCVVLSGAQLPRATRRAPRRLRRNRRGPGPPRARTVLPSFLYASSSPYQSAARHITRMETFQKT